jgi:serine protease AprX
MVGGHGTRRRQGIVFGIRWDGGKRPRGRWIAASAILLAAALAPATAIAQRDASPRLEVFVVPAPGRTADARELICRLGGHAGRRIDVAHGFAAHVPADRLAALRRSGAVRLAAPDVALHVNGAAPAPAVGDRADDVATAAGKAAGSTAILRSASGAQALQDAGTDGAGVGVALVDSGVMQLPGLDSGQVVTGPDFSDEARFAGLRGRDAFGHGTHLAGVIAGDDPASGFVGIAPHARLISVKVADSDGQTSLLQVLAGLDWVDQHHADPGLNIRVVNLSLGVDPEKAGYVRDPLAYAAETLWKAGIVVVAAAGNNGVSDEGLDIPAADPYLIAAGALDTNGTLRAADDHVADFSSRGTSRLPDLVAPGTGVVSLRVPGSALDMEFPGARVGARWFRGSGTSQATAVVSGLAALLLERRPGLAPDQVKALLKAGADAAGDPVSAAGAGRADAARSAALATPVLGVVAQHWTPAVLDPQVLKKRGNRNNGVGSGNAEWAGRRWSGRRWSGRRWSGSAWVTADPGS